VGRCFIGVMSTTCILHVQWYAEPPHTLGGMPRECSIGWYWSCAPMFFQTVWFQRECGEALLSVATIEHVLRSMVKSDAENDMEIEFLLTSNSGLSLCGDEDLSC
jgi:hypothetical protein